MAAPVVRFRIDFAEHSSVGPWKICLLEAIRDAGSLSLGAQNIGMSYRRAWLLVESLKQAFGEPVTVASTGGMPLGGGDRQVFGCGDAQLTRLQLLGAQRRDPLGFRERQRALVRPDGRAQSERENREHADPGTGRLQHGSVERAGATIRTRSTGAQTAETVHVSHRIGRGRHTKSENPLHAIARRSTAATMLAVGATGDQPVSPTGRGLKAEARRAQIREGLIGRGAARWPRYRCFERRRRLKVGGRGHEGGRASRNIECLTGQGGN